MNDYGTMPYKGYRYFVSLYNDSISIHVPGDSATIRRYQWKKKGFLRRSVHDPQRVVEAIEDFHEKVGKHYKGGELANVFNDARSLLTGRAMNA